jgi:hypothetical protein
MNGAPIQKPSFDEYMYWSQVIIDRLTTVVHVYTKPPHVDVFMPENERQLKIAQTADVLRHLHDQTDDNELRAAHPAEKPLESEERVIENILPLFHDVLHRLPLWSSDMQHLLKSAWFDNCAGKLANILFRGPDGRETEGIGSGQAIHGRLPAQIEVLLEREQMGDSRAPREALPPKAAKQMGRTELAKRWSQQNSSFLRSAGRMD